MHPNPHIKKLMVEGCQPVFIDFDFIIQRQIKRSQKPPLLIKACQAKPGLHILDASAGLGRDAAKLAVSGAIVTMCERVPEVQALLKDGLNRLSETGQSIHLNLILDDAQNYLKTLEPVDYPDVIYYDPMHPMRSKSALVKNDIRALQQLIGPDLDVTTCIELLRRYAKKRVVVKWPKKSKALVQPQFVLNGKTVRYDVYLPIT